MADKKEKYELQEEKGGAWREGGGGYLCFLAYNCYFFFTKIHTSIFQLFDNVPERGVWAVVDGGGVPVAAPLRGVPVTPTLVCLVRF